MHHGYQLLAIDTQCFRRTICVGVNHIVKWRILRAAEAAPPPSPLKRRTDAVTHSHVS